VQVQINEQPLNITLEKEKTLGDLIEGIRDWLGDSEYIISSIEYDGQVIVPDETPRWEEIDLVDIGTLNLTVLSPGEKQLQDLQTIHQFIVLLHKALSSGNYEIINQLRDEAPYVVNTLDYILGERATGYGQKLAELLDAAGVNSGELTTRVQDLLSYTKNLTRVLEDRIREASDPFTELTHTASTLKELTPKLMDVSVLLQTGKDREAMNRVIEFTELADKLIRIYGILQKGDLPDISSVEVDGTRFDHFYEDFNNNLRELIEAFDNQDSVLIGDLIEYEIAPRAEQLQHYIEAFEKRQTEETRGS